METVKLNNGVEMPVLGVGTFLLNDPKVCEQTVVDAIGMGYRLIDTAQGYGNEEHIGRGIARCGVKREELFITTKVWFRNYDSARASIEESMHKLQTDYLDLVLLHWPFGDTYAAWHDLEAMYAEGCIRAIGVSNYTPDRLVDLVNYNKIIPAVNQIETNLIAQQQECHQWMEKLGVRHMGYAPFGQGKLDELYSNDTLRCIASHYGKTTRQIALRFQIQQGVIVIPKTTVNKHLAENLDVFDFNLLDKEMETLKAFDKNSPLIGNPQNAELVASSVNW